MVDSVTFDKQITDISYGRYPNGSSIWGFMTGTPSTQNSPHNAPPQITGMKHTPDIPDEDEQACTVTDDGIVADVRLTYNAGNGLVNIPMHDDGMHNDVGSGDGLYGAQIHAFSKDTVVDYYVTATDNFGSQSVDPVTAPDMTYSYVVDYVVPLL